MAKEDPFGGLSQDDIDAALAEATGAKPTPQAHASPPAENAPLSQDEIDAAFGGSGFSSDPAAAASPPPKETRVDAAGNPFDDAAAEMAAIIEQEKKASASSKASADPPTQPLEMPDFTPNGATRTEDHQIDLLEDVELNVKIELGRTRMLVEDVLQLGEGSVVELDKLAGDPVDVLVNDRLVARGEVLVLNDNFCVRINEIISQTGVAVRS